MTAVVQATCPGCKKTLRVPADWLQQAIRCKYCGLTLQAKSRPSGHATPLPSKTVSGSGKNSGVQAPLASPVPNNLPIAPIAHPVAGPAFDLNQSAGPNDFTVMAEDPFPNGYIRRRRARRGPGILWLVCLGMILASGLGGVGFIFYKQRHQFLPPVEGEGDKDPRGKGSTLGTMVYPRRALVINVNNYLYANPVSHGQGSQAKPSLVEKLKSGLRISADQIAELSDAAPGGYAKPPLKPVIEQNITQFLGTCRKQDRALLFFIGHAVEIDNDAYLMPIEGDREDKESLIPLKWVYGQLEKCPARQKVLVLDVSRFNMARGLERPDSGPLGEKLDAALKNPPAGVQVWSACVGGQKSYEVEDGAYADGLFELSIRNLFTKGLSGIIQKPEDPLPLTQLVAEVNKVIKDELAGQGIDQTTRLTGEEAKDGEPYDAEEAPAAAVVAEVPKALVENSASRKLIASILKEIEVPPIKMTNDDMAIKFESLPPFSKDKMEAFGYAAEKADDPLRQAVDRARNALRSLYVGDKKLQEDFRNPLNEAAFKLEMTKIGQEVSKSMALFQDVLEDLKDKEVLAIRKTEPKRWQANYDYMVARVNCEIAYLYEYASVIGKLKKELPPLDAKVYGGWRLASQPDLEGDRTGQSAAKEANKIYDKLIKDFPDTPWAVLAKRDKLTALGLKWEQVK